MYGFGRAPTSGERTNEAWNSCRALREAVCLRLVEYEIGCLLESIGALSPSDKAAPNHLWG